VDSRFAAGRDAPSAHTLPGHHRLESDESAVKWERFSLERLGENALWGIAIHAALPYISGMQTVLETSIFSRRADALLSREERAELINLLASDPQDGDVIPGTGGIRKLRFAAGGQGKRGAFRVVYYVLNDDMPVLALLIYGKGEQVNPTPEQKRAMATIVAGFRTAHGQRRKA
jgi:hypothetical protein